MSIDKRSYLGDGVYAKRDGDMIWLETERENGTHRIALEPEVFMALIAFATTIGWGRLINRP
jgi:hypothetical protein